MDRPARFQCPKCNAYVRAQVKEPRVQSGWVLRRRRCETCGARIVTREMIIGTTDRKKGG